MKKVVLLSILFATVGSLSLSAQKNNTLTKKGKETRLDPSF